MNSSILSEADDLVHGARAVAYGPVKDSFERIAKMWSVIVDKEVSAEQVGLMLITMKVCRQINKSKRDNLVDIAGYAACNAQLIEEIPPNGASQTKPNSE